MFALVVQPLRLAAKLPAPALDLLFGKSESTDGYDPTRLRPASYPADYGTRR